MLPSFCKTTVTVSRAPMIIERGKKVRDWEHATTHTVPGCSVQPVSTDGTWGEPRSGAEIRATLYAPPGADIEFGDKIQHNGREFAMDGEPLAWESPTGRVDHLVAYLVDWRG